MEKTSFSKRLGSAPACRRSRRSSGQPLMAAAWIGYTTSREGFTQPNQAIRGPWMQLNPFTKRKLSKHSWYAFLRCVCILRAVNSAIAQWTRKTKAGGWRPLLSKLEGLRIKESTECLQELKFWSQNQVTSSCLQRPDKPAECTLLIWASASKLLLYVHVCVCMHVYIYIAKCVCVCVRVHVYMYIYIERERGGVKQVLGTVRRCSGTHVLW